MTDVPQEWVEKAASVLERHPAYSTGNDQQDWFKAKGAAEAVLAAVLPDVRPVVDREALAEHCLVTPVQCGCGERLNQGWSLNRQQWADHVLASGVLDSKASVVEATRRQVAEEIARDLARLAARPDTDLAAMGAYYTAARIARAAADTGEA